MTISELNEYILHYMEKDKTQTAIMLTGEWGSGKTYYIENELLDYLKEQEKTTIVVSLYGLDDTTAISKSIYMELRIPKFKGINSEGVVTGKVFAKSVLKNITGAVGINLEIPDKDLVKLYSSVDLSGKLLILEDVERSNIEITKLLGYVNGLVERDGVKVLLVANEDEILGKNKSSNSFNYSNINAKDDEDKEISEKVKKYLRVKEKTVSDTIQFNVELKKAIHQIVSDFDNEKLNLLFEENDELYDELSGIVSSICCRNLRIFVFAVQKAVDLIEGMDYKEYDNRFYECLLKGILYFSAYIKKNDFPSWKGSGYLSTELGSNEMPLMRFAYDYIRWKTFDKESVDKAYKAYNDFSFLETNVESKDEDFGVLIGYYEKTENQVLEAFKNIENKLNDREKIGIRVYCKLAYYLIYVGSQIGFDYKKSLKLMIENAKGIGKGSDILDEFVFLNVYEFKDSKMKKEYDEFIKELSDSISYENLNYVLSYNPEGIAELYLDVCKNKYKYIKDHRFLSKYDVNRIIEMLVNSNSKQICDYRGILLAIYRDAVKGEFDESDIDVMKQMLDIIENQSNIFEKFDKIQMMQIGWLKSNLNDFIQAME